MENINIEELELRAMEELEEILQMDSGFHLRSSPTGSGKTHLVAKAIMNYAYKTALPIGKRFLFIGPQKKNLDAFCKYRDYQKYVLEIKSQDDCFVEFFQNNDGNDLPFLDNDMYHELKIGIMRYKELINIFNVFNENKAAISNVNAENKEAFIKNIKNLETSIKSEKNKIIKPFYHALHDYMSNFFKNHITEKQEENKNAYQTYSNLLNNKELTKSNWLKILSPEYYLPLYRIGVMTALKFLHPIHYGKDKIDFFRMIIKTSEKPNFTIVFDEFDKLKPILRNYIISKTVAYPADICNIMNSLSVKKLRLFGTEMKDALGKSKIYSNLITKIERLKKKYRFNLPYYVETTENENFIGIFDSFQFSALYINKSNKENEIMLKYSKKDNKIIRDFSNSTSSFSLKRFVEDAISCISMEKSVINYLALSLSAEKLYSYDDNVTSYLHYYNLDKSPEKEYFMNNINIIPQKLNNRTYVVHPLSRGFYYVLIKNESSHYDHSFFINYNMRYTPEIILGNICKTYNVIGISATGTMQTLDNFAFDYLKELLENKFYLHHKHIDNYYKYFYDTIQKDYIKNNISLSASYVISSNLLPSKEKIKNMDIDYFGDIFQEEKFNFKEKISIACQKELASLLYGAYECENDKSEFQSQRFFQILLAIMLFLSNNNHHWGIFFTQYGFKSETNMNGFKNPELFKRIVNLLAREFKVDSYEPIFYSDFNSFVKNLHEAYKTKNKVLIFSAYNSLGAGVNLQGIPTNNQPLLSVLNDFKTDNNDKRYKQRDIDFMYLSSIHFKGITSSINDLSLLTSDEQTKHEKILHSISLLDEFKKRSGANLTLYNFQKLLSAIASFNLKPFNNFKNFRDKPLIANSYLLIILQAVGRMNRSFVKNQNITILLDNDFRNFSFTYDTDSIMTPEFRSVVELFQNNNNLLPPYTDLQEQTRNNTFSLYQFMSEILKDLADVKAELAKEKGNDTHRKNLKKICDNYECFRETLLKHPTPKDKSQLSFPSGLSPMIDYSWIENSWKDAKYYYEFFKNFYSPKKWWDTGIDASYISINESGKGIEVSSKTAGLDIFMQNPIIYHEFIKQGIATKWEHGQYLMNPYAFHIYKGILGEKVAEILFSHFGLPLAELNSEFTEKFDFRFEKYPDVMIDIKHWSDFTSGDAVVKAKEKIFGKMDKTGSTKIFMIKIFPSSENNELIPIRLLAEDEGKKIYSVEGICNRDGSQNMDIFEKIKNIL